MDTIRDFTSAALPWILMGLLLAIFIVKEASGKKSDKG